MLVRPVTMNSYKGSVSFLGAEKKQQSKNKPVSEPFSEQRMARDIDQALEALGNKKLQIIMHNASAPSKANSDIGRGSLYSNSSKEILIPFFDKYGISGVQNAPEGMLPKGDSSPYVSNSFVYDPLLCDIEDLTKPENGALLSKTVYDVIVQTNPSRGKDKGDYQHARDGVGVAMSAAWDTFKEKSANLEAISNPVEKDAIVSLNKQFVDYKLQNGDMLEPYAIYYNVLTPKYNNDYYMNWPKEARDLYNPKNESLIAQIRSENQDEIDKFIFVDMLTKNSRDKGIAEFAKNGIRTLGDNPVAFSNPEVWANKGAFLQDYKMGCPPDGGNPNGQAWGFAVLNPAKLFNKDGSLGQAGELLYEKCEKLARDNQGGIRIDHVVGLIDPFVYKNSPVEFTAGRLYSSEHNPDLKQFAIPRGRGDSAEKFGAILEKIVIPACKEGGLDKEDIICEDLGSMPDHARAAFKRLGLGGMNVTQWYNGAKAKPYDTIMLGSHDTAPFVSYADSLYGPYGQDDFNHKLWTAVENSSPKTASKDQKQAKFDKYRFDYNRHQPDKNKQAFVQMKFTELFTSPAQRVQIFWTDLLGSNARYNVPGTTEGNWSLRLSSDFEQNFDPSNLIKGLEGALKAQDPKFVSEHKELIANLHEDADKMAQKTGSKLNFDA